MTEKHKQARKWENRSKGMEDTGYSKIEREQRKTKEGERDGKGQRMTEKHKTRKKMGNRSKRVKENGYSIKERK